MAARAAIRNVIQSPVNGSAIVGAELTITVHEPGASELGKGAAATIYKSETGSEHTATNTLTSDSKGGFTQGSGSGFAEYWLPVGRYDLKFHGAELTSFYVVQDFLSGETGQWEPGDLKLSAASSLPSGWLRCEGQEVSRSTYAALFAAVGTSNGEGNKTTTFNVPDYRGRVPMGAGTGTGGEESEAFPARTLGQKVGALLHKLTTAQLAKHGHPLTDPGHGHNMFSEEAGGAAPNVEEGKIVGDTAGGGSDKGLANNYSGSFKFRIGVSAAKTGITAAETGSGEAHNIVQPATVCNVWIKT